jgi:hypothetical protein
VGEILIRVHVESSMQCVLWIWSCVGTRLGDTQNIPCMCRDLGTNACLSYVNVRRSSLSKGVTATGEV